jgi:serine/threonine-protein kinase
MRVTDSIRLVRKLGEGGMGSVWVAHHARLRADVAVKFLTQQLATDAVAAARMTNEAAAIARVRSPHIVQVLDHGTVSDDGQPFIVMELLEGEDLRSRLRKNDRLPLDEAARIAAQIAAALARAHERGIVHRDIKPANVFLCDVGAGPAFVKVLDFGIAKADSAAGSDDAVETESGAILGTPAYMSPEQLIGSRKIDHRADLWALAAVTFRMLTGETPYAGDSVGALALEIHTGRRRVASAIAASIPAAVDAWFERAFERDPEARFQSAKEMADALLAATALPLDTRAPSQADGATAETAVEFPVRTERRKPARIVFVALAVSVAALSVWGGIELSRAPTSPSGRSAPAPTAAELPSPSSAPIAGTAATTELPTSPPPALPRDAAPPATRQAPTRVPRTKASARPVEERDIE